MKILIAGGTGYIGSRLAEHFAKFENHVTILTRKSKSTLPLIDKVEYREIDWDNFGYKSLRFNEIDLVINAAGMTSQDLESQPRAAEYFVKNVTEKLLAASNDKVNRFIQLSSIHVYGRNLHGVIREDSKTDCDSPYAINHLKNENLVSAASGLTSNILRLSNVVGPPGRNEGDCWNLAVNQMCRQAILTKTIQLRTSGLQVRNFLPISKLIHGVSAIIDSDSKKSLPSVLNFGGRKSISVLDAAEIIQSRCEVKFGFTPNIKIGSTKDQENFQFFEYGSNYLNDLILTDSISLIDEIDATLNFVDQNENN